MTSVKQVLQELFPGDQLTTLLGMIGVFAMIIFVGAMRAKFWQDRGDSAVFLKKRDFRACSDGKTQTTAQTKQRQGILPASPASLIDLGPGGSRV